MIRAPLGEQPYWDEGIKFFQDALNGDLRKLGSPSKNPPYEPQYWFDHSKYTLRLILVRYSGGDPVPELGEHFGGLLDGWELSNRLLDELWQSQGLKTRRDWTFELTNLNHYNWCFWLVGLALTLQIPDNQWRRLVALVDGAGQDILLDRVIATRQSDRVIGTGLLHRKPYARLLKAIDANKSTQPALLRDFVDHWYTELARKGREELWWYIYGDPVKHPLSMGSYFGRWCIEAAVVSKVFGIDDSFCLGHEHYPGDLLRPNSPSTHPVREGGPKKSFFRALFGGKR